MRTILLLYDTLAKKYLEPFGNVWTKTPNFQRLSEKTITFDNHYAGSLPCIPARRELQTGKYNFLHRGWGPMEPFDFSVIEAMREGGVYTHLATDHSHYFEDGGATFHTRFDTWEGFRGQEGDRWAPHRKEIDMGQRNPLSKDGISTQQHYHNIQRMATENEMSLAKTFEAGLGFLEDYKDEDDWFLQMECFDPHEPFYVPEEYRDLYEFNQKEVMFNWPKYMPIEAEEHAEDLQDLKANYAALLTMCDVYLGKLLDYMDENDMWKDTALIVNTDHGFLLGEHDWLGKNIPPAYNDVVQLPLFIWHPEIGGSGERRDVLTQSVDLVPTLMDFFDIEKPENLDGTSLLPVLKENQAIHNYVLFGVHGGAVNITDGEHVYMRDVVDTSVPFEQYTLMPTNMRGFMAQEYIDQATLIDGGRYANGHKCLKIDVPRPSFFDMVPSPGHLLFNVKKDPDQLTPLQDKIVEQQFVDALRKKMKELEAPQEEFKRFDLETK